MICSCTTIMSIVYHLQMSSLYFTGFTQCVQDNRKQCRPCTGQSQKHNRKEVHSLQAKRVSTSLTVGSLLQANTFIGLSSAPALKTFTTRSRVKFEILRQTPVYLCPPYAHVGQSVGLSVTFSFPINNSIAP